LTTSCYISECESARSNECESARSNEQEDPTNNQPMTANQPTATDQQASTSSLPACIEIPVSNNARKFGMVSSSEINKRSLVNPDVIIAKYKNYHKESKVSTLAQ